MLSFLSGSLASTGSGLHAPYGTPCNTCISPSSLLLVLCCIYLPEPFLSLLLRCRLWTSLVALHYHFNAHRQPPLRFLRFILPRLGTACSHRKPIILYSSLDPRILPYVAPSRLNTTPAGTSTGTWPPLSFIWFDDFRAKYPSTLLLIGHTFPSGSLPITLTRLGPSLRSSVPSYQVSRHMRR